MYAKIVSGIATVALLLSLGASASAATSVKKVIIKPVVKSVAKPLLKLAPKPVVKPTPKSVVKAKVKAPVKPASKPLVKSVQNPVKVEMKKEKAPTYPIDSLPTTDQQTAGYQ